MDIILSKIGNHLVAELVRLGMSSMRRPNENSLTIGFKNKKQFCKRLTAINKAICEAVKDEIISDEDISIDDGKIVFIDKEDIRYVIHYSLIGRELLVRVTK